MFELSYIYSGTVEVKVDKLEKAVMGQMALVYETNKWWRRDFQQKL